MSDPQKIMVVDDTRENLQLLGDMLKSSGYRVFSFPRGDLALRAAKRTPPDLILLDINMPGLNGFDVCELLKADERLRDIPVIFLSALNDTENKVRGLSVGAVDYITKPIQYEEVHARVETHLRLRQQRLVLAKQNAMLKEAELFRQEVEAITRHDLKSPLAAIIGFSRFLSGTGTNLTAEQRGHLRRIEEAGHRMLAMINASLDVFKLEQGLYEYQPRLFDLTETLREVIDAHHPVAESLGVSFWVHFNGKPLSNAEQWAFNGEVSLLYSMLSNLVMNAVEASPRDNKVTIDVNCSSKRITVEIVNQGEVPPSVRSRFFDKYVTGGKEGGTGIGTYSARLMAQTMSGNVELDTSKSGKTTIRVTLPNLNDA